MQRPSDEKIRELLERHTRAFRTELKGAFDRPPSEIEIAFQKRVNEVEELRPGRGPLEAAQELRGGQLRNEVGRAFEPKCAAGAREAISRAADHAEKAFTYKGGGSYDAPATDHLREFHREIEKAFGRPPSEIEEAFAKRASEIEEVLPGRGSAEAAHEMRAGQLRDVNGQAIPVRHAPGAREATERAAEHGAKAFEAQLLRQYPQRQPVFDLTRRINELASHAKEEIAKVAEKVSTVVEKIAPPSIAPAPDPVAPAAATPPSSGDPILDAAKQKVDKACEANAYALSMKEANKHAVEAAGVLKQINSTDALVQTTERRFMAEMGKVYKDPMAAVKKFEKLAGTNNPAKLAKAVEAFAKNPAKFGDLIKHSRDGIAGRLLPATTARAKAHSAVVATYADSFTQAQRARDRQASTIEWRDPATNTVHEGWVNVKAAADKRLTDASIHCADTNLALKAMGGLHGTKMEAAQALALLPPEQKIELDQQLAAKANPMKTAFYHKIMAVQQAIQLPSSVMRAFDPSG